MSLPGYDAWLTNDTAREAAEAENEAWQDYVEDHYRLAADQLGYELAAGIIDDYGGHLLEVGDSPYGADYSRLAAQLAAFNGWCRPAVVRWAIDEKHLPPPFWEREDDPDRRRDEREDR